MHAVDVDVDGRVGPDHLIDALILNVALLPEILKQLHKMEESQWLENLA
jgi:hypothetical protein